MTEEFILKACKLFQRCVDAIIKKMMAILSKFIVLCLSSYFSCLFYKNQNKSCFIIELFIIILEYYTRIFLILLLHSVHMDTPDLADQQNLTSV